MIFNFTQSALVIFFYMSAFFFLSVIKKRADIADIAWGLGFIVVALTLLFNNTLPPVKQIIITVLVIIWGLRLTGHIWWRNKDKAEDYRYAGWRKDWGKWFLLRSFWQVFMLQGFFMFLIATPIIISASLPSKINYLDLIGILIWLMGFYFESISDYQLLKFTSDQNNKGKVMNQGLWHFTHHPNYFGEVSQWWGIFIIASTLPYGLLAIISPLVITFLIIGVSGIPMLEKKYQDHPEYKRYQKTTNSFFPWFPKKI